LTLTNPEFHEPGLCLRSAFFCVTAARHIGISLHVLLHASGLAFRTSPGIWVQDWHWIEFLRSKSNLKLLSSCTNTSKERMATAKCWKVYKGTSQQLKSEKDQFSVCSCRSVQLTRLRKLKKDHKPI
jgi:hypothetical protein